MGWDIEFNELTESYRLVFDDSNTFYDLEASNYESALDEAGKILEDIGFYEEA